LSWRREEWAVTRKGGSFEGPQRGEVKVKTRLIILALNFRLGFQSLARLVD
jgi:hypothetical protein